MRSILEEVLLDIMYEIPSREDIKKCLITKETIESNGEPTLVLSDRKSKNRASEKSNKESVS